MAKQKKSETAPTTSTTPSAPAAGAESAPAKSGFPARSSHDGDVFTRVLGPDGKGVAPAKKIAPQAMVILNTIEAAGEKGIRRDNLAVALKGVLVTRQPEGRIVSYYQKSISEVEKLVTITKVVTAAAPAA